MYVSMLAYILLYTYVLGFKSYSCKNVVRKHHVFGKMCTVSPPRGQTKLNRAVQAFLRQRVWRQFTD